MNNMWKHFQTTGNSGTKLGCCVITELIDEEWKFISWVLKTKQECLFENKNAQNPMSRVFTFISSTPHLIQSNSFYLSVPDSFQNYITKAIHKFKFIGFVHKCQLLFSSHIDALNIKTKSRIWYLIIRII